MKPILSSFNLDHLKAEAVRNMGFLLALAFLALLAACLNASLTQSAVREALQVQSERIAIAEHRAVEVTAK